METPSCWSKAAWGAGAVTEVAAVSSGPAPHTAIAAVAGAPRRWSTRYHGSYGAVGTPIPNPDRAEGSPLSTPLLCHRAAPAPNGEKLR